MEWLRTLLKTQGVTDEQIEKIIADVAKEASKHVIPKEKYNELSTAKRSLETQLTERDTQLEELKKVDVEGLQAKITELQQMNETAKQQHEQQLKDERLSSALKLALNGKVHDVDLVAGLIDRNPIELDKDGNVAKGLDEQLKTLQESKSFLFVPEKPNTPQFKGFTPVEGSGGSSKGEEISFGKQIAEERSKGTEQLNNARDSYFK